MWDCAGARCLDHYFGAYVGLRRTLSGKEAWICWDNRR
jgi:hypothetical protein